MEIYLANIIINDEFDSQYLVQVWDMTSQPIPSEKLVIFIKHAKYLEYDILPKIVENSLYDKFKIRNNFPVAINPSDYVLSDQMFEEVIIDAETNGTYFILEEDNLRN